MVPLPSVFISHGSPMHALEAGPAGLAWAALGKRLGKPEATAAALRNGAWLALVGLLLGLAASTIGGFLGTRRQVELEPESGQIVER